MRVPRRILVPTDLSSFSLEAMEYADQIAKLFNGEIIIFHALPPKHDHSGTEQEDEFEARKAIIHLLMERNIVPQNLKLELGSGTPVEAIVVAALQLRADIIVMSTHGRTGVPHALLGSITEQVVRLSSVPVLTVKPEGFNDLPGVREDDVKANLHLN